MGKMLAIGLRRPLAQGLPERAVGAIHSATLIAGKEPPAICGCAGKA
jgi:hypothetical protein